MKNSAELRKQNNQAHSPSGFNKEDIFPPSGIGIAAMTAAMAKKAKKHYKKDGGVAPSGGIEAMEVARVP